MSKHLPTVHPSEMDAPNGVATGEDTWKRTARRHADSVVEVAVAVAAVVVVRVLLTFYAHTFFIIITRVSVFSKPKSNKLRTI